MKKNLLRIALLFITLSLSLSSFADNKGDIYTDGLRTLMKNGAINVLNSSQLSKLAASTGGNAEQFFEDLIEISAPYYRNNMSEEEFKQMVAFYQKPEITAITKKIVNGNNLSQEQMMQDIMPKMMQMMQGGTVEPIKVEGCSDEFIEAFNRFYSLSNGDKAMNGTFDFLKQKFEGMKQSIPAMQQGAVMDALNKLVSFMKENIKPVTMMILSKSLTVDDLNTVCSVTNEPFYPALQKTNDAIAADIPVLMQKIMGKINIPGM